MGEKEEGRELGEDETPAGGAEGAPEGAGAAAGPADTARKSGTDVPVHVKGSRQKLKARVQELEESLSRLEEERDRLEDLWLRARADLENYRKRTERERGELERRAGERILLGLIEVRDNLEKALSSEEGPEEGPLREGLVLIEKQMSELLAREGVNPIEAMGAGFDPQFHEAVMQVESDEHESNTVVQELQTGYLLGDRLLRPARVAVAK